MDRNLFTTIRKLSGLTQYDMAAILGVSRSLVAKIEVAERGLDAELSAKVKEVFGAEYVEKVQALTKITN